MSKNIKYFVCDRWHNYVDEKFAKEFYEERKNSSYFQLHNSLKAAQEEMHNGFYDDSDYRVVKFTFGKYFQVLK